MPIDQKELQRNVKDLRKELEEKIEKQGEKICEEVYREKEERKDTFFRLDKKYDIMDNRVDSIADNVGINKSDIKTLYKFRDTLYNNIYKFTGLVLAPIFTAIIIVLWTFHSDIAIIKQSYLIIKETQESILQQFYNLM